MRMENDFMKNMKLLHICWTCQKEHHLPNLGVREYGVKCDNCQGYIVSPSGKVQCTLVPVVPVYKVDDGERHWFAAENEDQVKEAYNALYDEELESEAIIEKVRNNDLHEKRITTEEGKKVSLFDIIKEQNHFPALLASSVW
jgi:hypothetical protein